jgi:AcrR family transcriptional regulator
VPRPTKPLLSRRGIAEEALALVEEEGMEALTTRRLARRLGVEGPSLYNHVANRDDLLDEMTAVIDEKVEHALLDHDDWRVGLVEFARSYRRAFMVRPQLVAAIASRPVRAGVALHAYDYAFAAFDRWGWDRRTGATVMAAIDFLVLGSCIETFAAGFDRPPDEYEPDYPHLAAALRATADDDVDDLGFELGMTALIAWLEQVEPRSTPG